jgi:hypothetical protein
MDWFDTFVTGGTVVQGGGSWGAPGEATESDRSDTINLVTNSVSNGIMVHNCHPRGFIAQRSGGKETQPVARPDQANRLTGQRVFHAKLELPTSASPTDVLRP